MNNILKEGNNPCCSCGVCAVSCPSNCIEIKLNDEGFYRPILDVTKCTDCGLCIKVCYKYISQIEPFNNYFEDKEIFASWSRDEGTRKRGTSGGVGHELLNKGIEINYKAVGVSFETKYAKCEHKIVDSYDGIKEFTSSKYLQSYTVNAFNSFEKGQKYIVVATPCQIFGLRELIKIQKREDDFILIDFFCHGTPSKLLWNKYEQFIKDKYNLSEFKTVLFRNKDNTTWHKYAIKIEDLYGNVYFQDRAYAEDLFYKFFLSGTCLNESCYDCQMRLDNCSSDIRLADFWGAKYRFNNEGVSLVCINTERGKNYFEIVENNLHVEKCTFDDLKNSQPSRFKRKNAKYSKVIKLLMLDEDLLHIYNKTIKYSFVKKLFLKLKRIVNAIKKRI